MKTSLLIATGISMAIIAGSLVAAEDQAKPPAKDSAGAPEQAGAPEKQATFQPVTLDPELVKQSMQARAEYETLNRQILARQTALYTNNPTIKDLQTQMREIQKKIDKILADDEELNKMKEKLKNVSPDMPVGMKKPGAEAPLGGSGATPLSATPVPAKPDKKP